MVNFENRNNKVLASTFLWTTVTALSQLKLFVYSYFIYDNANLPYAVAMTWLYYVSLSFCYVLKPFAHVMQSCYNCIVTLPYPKFIFDHVHFLSDGITFLFGWVDFPFRFVKKTFKSCFSFYSIFSSYTFQSYVFHLHTFNSYTFHSYTFHS